MLLYVCYGTTVLKHALQSTAIAAQAASVGAGCSACHCECRFVSYSSDISSSGRVVSVPPNAVNFVAEPVLQGPAWRWLTGNTLTLAHFDSRTLRQEGSVATTPF